MGDADIGDGETPGGGDDVVLDEFTLVEFNCGACGDFAAVMHEITGWPLMAELESGTDVAHIWVVAPDGRAVDINGHHEGPRGITPYSPVEAGPIVPISLERAMGKGRHGQEYRDWARALIERYPDRFGLPTPSVAPTTFMP